MAVGFDSILFDVMVEDDIYMPSPLPDENGFKWLDATLRFESRDDFDAMNLLLSAVDIQPAMAMRGGGIVSLRWGVGSKTLIYPLGNAGDERSRSAILVSFTSKSDLLRDLIEADARFLVFGTT